MPIIRATAVLNLLSGRPEDACRNVWHFDAPNDEAATLTAIGNAVGLFYSTISSRIGSSVSRAANAHRVELSEVSEGGEGAEDDTVSVLLGTTQFGTITNATAGDPIPNQVAIGVSFNALLGTLPEEAGLIRPRARRRGRIYLGPVAGACFSERTTTKEAMVNSITREAILDAYDQMHVSLFTNAPLVTHGVYSRADGLIREVVSVQVDESPDVIRRRKVRPTVRMQREVEPGVNTGTARTGADQLMVVR